MDMQLGEVIRNRRSVGVVKQDAVDKDKIEKLLQAAVWAPNHRVTEPWRFFVMSGDGRGVLGRALVQIASEKLDVANTLENQAQLKKQYDKAFRAPVVIAVAAVMQENGVLERTEDLAAVHAAMQNMLLTAYSLGLGAIWRTGEPAYHPITKAAFGLQDKDEIAGFLYLGYPLKPPHVRKMPSYADKTKWYE
jgi:nitroreductase